MILSDTKLAEFEAAIDNLRRVKQAAREHWLDKTGLSEQQTHVLCMLSQAGDQTATAAARSLGVTASAGTQTVETLVRRGLVARATDPHDRRVTRLELTQSGAQLANGIARNRHHYFMSILAQLSPAEVDSMIKTLTTLARVMDEQHQHISTERTN